MSRHRGVEFLAALAGSLAGLLFSSQLADAQFVQQGAKLVGAGAIGAATQGYSVALSADGNTGIIGGRSDNGSIGAAWVYTRSGGGWTQQAKLVGTGAVGSAQQGVSVALSADGNTAIIGGDQDQVPVGFRGSAWIFTRSGGVWTQQGSKLEVGDNGGLSVSLSCDGNTAIVGSRSGPAVYTRSGGIWTQQGGKLVGTGAVGGSQMGVSVSLSCDGNTAIAGGPSDNAAVGAAWVFTRSGGIWTQQGNKLVGTGAAGHAIQGTSVALSADGDTAIVGGPCDSEHTVSGCDGPGAAWVFTRSGGVWTQQGNKIVGAGVEGLARQGTSVSISSDGDTAIVGGFLDNNQVGAAWVFKRAGGVWSQLSSKLVGSGATGMGWQGWAVALSSDGGTAIVGGIQDNGTAGAAWVYVNKTPPLACPSVSRLADFNGDTRADMLLRRNDGMLAFYFMNGLQIASAQLLGPIGVEWSLVGTGDFNGDGKADLLLRRADGILALYLMNGANVIAAQLIGQIGSEWKVVGVGDFNGDGRGDFMTRRADGTFALYLMNGFQFVAAQVIGQIGSEWTIAQIADFNGDGRADFLARRVDGMLVMYLLDGFQLLSAAVIGNVGPDWRLIAAGDINGDGRADLMMRRTDGTLALYLMNGAQFVAAQVIGIVGLEFEFVGNGDLNGDAKSDLAFRRSDGMLSFYLLDGFQVLGSALLGSVGTDWDSCYGQGGGGIARVGRR